MKTTAFLTKMTCGLVVLFVFSFFGQTEAVSSEQGCQWTPVDQNSFPKILTMIGNRVRENYYKISTWQGRVKIVADVVDEGAIAEKMFRKRLRDDGQPIPNKIKEHQELTREFALDINKELLYESHYLDGRHEIIDVETGRKLQLKELVRLSPGKVILTPDYHLDCMHNENRDGVIVSRTVIKQARPQGELTCRIHLLPVYDPRESLRVFGDPLGETFAKYLAYIDKHGQSSTLAGYTMKVEVEECNVGDVKKYKIVLPGVSSGGPKVYISSTLVCSSEAGFNVVSCSTTDSNDRVFGHKTWDYGLINGVYLPLQTTDVRFDYQTGNLDAQSTFTFIGQKVNHPISDEVFTYKNLGLQNGDKFIDKILNKEYTYQDGELIPTSQNKSNLDI